MNEDTWTAVKEIEPGWWIAVFRRPDGEEFCCDMSSLKTRIRNLTEQCPNYNLGHERAALRELERLNGRFRSSAVAVEDEIGL